MQAKFHDHKVTDKGLYIRGLSGPAMSPDVEIFVDREDAEQFGWIDPIDGVQEDEAEQQAKQLKRLQGTLGFVLDELESIADAHHNDMSPTPKRRVNDLIALIKETITTKAPAEKPVTAAKTIPIVYTEDEEPDDIAEREKMLKKLAEWNAMSQRG